MKRLFVGNVAWKASEDTLRPLFEEYGPVASIRIATDKISGRSKGFAFVDMESAEAAQNAIQGLDNKPFMERNLRVSLAQPKPEGENNRRGSAPRRSYSQDSGY